MQKKQINATTHTLRRILQKLSARKLFASGLILTIAASLVVILIKSPLFAINDISFTWKDAKRIPQKQIEDLIKNGCLGKNVFTFNPEAFAEHVCNYSLTIAQVDLHKKIPNKLAVFVKGRIPLAALEASESAKLEEYAPLVVDKAGLVFDYILKDERLPLLKLVDASLSVGSRLSVNEITAYLAVLEETNIYNLDIVWLAYSTQSVLEFQLQNGPVVWLVSQPAENIPKDISSLRLILEKYKIEGRELEKVDLRFKKPVVKFK